MEATFCNVSVVKLLYFTVLITFICSIKQVIWWVIGINVNWYRNFCLFVCFVKYVSQPFVTGDYKCYTGINSYVMQLVIPRSNSDTVNWNHPAYFYTETIKWNCYALISHYNFRKLTVLISLFELPTILMRRINRFFNLLEMGVRY